MVNPYRVFRLRAFPGGLAFLLAFLASVARGSSVGQVDPASLAEWQTFRGAQPFQTQIVGVTPPSPSGIRTLIISEPPPRVTLQAVSGLLAAYAAGCAIKEWQLMSGGAVADIVCTLNRRLGEGWPETLAALQRLLYGTAEGAPAVALPAPARRMIAHSLDLRFSAGDLLAWLTEGQQRFRTGPLGAAVSLHDILNGSARGVFTNDARTLVLWVVDRGAVLSGADADIRRFAVGSDLVLGAVATRTAVAIVGRARLESLAHLPPLRSETVLLLAGSPENQLSQSYERNDLLAGKGSDGVDRAPILLSPQLVDTELGTLLNIADQLLKGWSMAGRTWYLQFPYPAPRSYPFGDKPAPDVDKERPSFLFNWNTDGAAYRQHLQGFDVVAPQRSGALSVIYGDPRDRPRHMEDVAYEYFAGSGDTTLVRVVQYTTLYQIFRQFNIRAAAPPVSARYAHFQSNVRAVTERHLKHVLGEMTEQDLFSALLNYWSKNVDRIPRSALPKGITTKADLHEKLVMNAAAIAVVLREAEAASQGRISGALADIASYMRRGKPPADEHRMRAALATLRTQLSEEQVVALLEDNGGALRESGLLQVAADRLSSWERVKTPTKTIPSWNRTAYVVESTGKGREAAQIGGHNIDAPVVRFRESATQAKGSISVQRDASGEWLVSHSPEDAARARDIARQVGTRKELTREQIEAEVAAALQKTPAARPVSMARVREVTGKSVDFNALPTAESAYRIRQLAEVERKLLAELAASKQEAIVVEQLADGSFVLSRTGSQEALQVASVTAATDALANGLIRGAGGSGGVSVYVRGIPDAKAEAMLGFVQSNLRRYPKQTVDHVLSAGGPRALLVERPALVNARIAHNGIRIETGAVKVTKMTSRGFEGFSRVEVPVTVHAKTPLLLRFIFYVKDLSAATVQTLLAKVSAVVATFKGPVSPADLQLAIRRQLEADLKSLHVDAVLMRIENGATGKVHDVIIASDEASSVQRA